MAVVIIGVPLPSFKKEKYNSELRECNMRIREMYMEFAIEVVFQNTNPLNTNQFSSLPYLSSSLTMSSSPR